MAMSDELEKLGDLHRRGVLSDQEFATAKARVIDAAATSSQAEPALAAINTLRRSRDNRWLGGVCGGLEQVTGLAAWMWRLMFALLMMCAGTGALAYLLLWIFVPEEPVRHAGGASSSRAAFDSNT